MDAEDAHAVYRNISTPEEEKTMGNKIFILWCLNDKYLLSASFLTSNNGTVYCCSNFRCHIYKYLLNIRTMLEGWERFWWAGDLGW